MPFPCATLVVIVVVLGLSDWLPKLIGVGISDPIALRIIALTVFVSTYVWQVWYVRRWWRTEDSVFK